MSSVMLDCDAPARADTDLAHASECFLLSSEDIEKEIQSTGACNWGHIMRGEEPVFAESVQDIGAFQRYAGTVAARSDFQGGGWTVRDERYVFPGAAACKSAELEYVAQARKEAREERTVRIEEVFARVLSGPTDEARARLTATLVAGKEAAEAQRVASNLAKSTFLHLIFSVGRVLVKLSVATTDGVSPVDISAALAKKAERLSRAWLATAPPGVMAVSPPTPSTAPATFPAPSAFPAPKPAPISPGTYDKADLKKALELRAAAAAAASPPTTTSSSNFPARSHQARASRDDASGPKALFRLGLFVAALGDGKLDATGGGRTAERLRTLAKVPKEQVVKVALPKGKGRRGNVVEEVDVELRLFIAHSDDAKMMQRYIDRHKNERPAPFVLLAPLLPVALEYRPAPHDAGSPAATQSTSGGKQPLPAAGQLLPAVADRLRKQAKGRAVRLVRDVLAEAGVDASTLRGHSGATRPVELLSSFFKKRFSQLDGSSEEQAIVFPLSAAQSPSPRHEPALFQRSESAPPGASSSSSARPAPLEKQRSLVDILSSAPAGEAARGDAPREAPRGRDSSERRDPPRRLLPEDEKMGFEGLLALASACDDPTLHTPACPPGGLWGDAGARVTPQPARSLLPGRSDADWGQGGERAAVGGLGALQQGSFGAAGDMVG
ncbi:hypothetical protein T484DRAFT_1887124, partial [Baffinella frigidus]